MNEWVNIFCIVASVFAIAALIYVVGSIIKGIRRKSDEQNACCQSSIGTEGILLVTGLLCATSGLFLGYAIAKEQERRAELTPKKRSKRSKCKW